MSFRPSIALESTEPRRQPRRRSTVIFLLLLSLGLGALFLARRTARDPVVGGLPFSHHLGNLILQRHSPEYQAATNALFTLGEDALPLILQKVQVGEPWYLSFYVNQRTNLPATFDRFLLKHLEPWKHLRQYNGAIRSVSILGTNAAPIAAQLAAELPNASQTQRGQLAEGLARIGPIVVEPVRPLLTHPDLRTRSVAVFVMHQLGVSASNAAPALIEGLRGADTNHRKLVGRTLARLGPTAAPYVLDLLRSTNQIEVVSGLEAAQAIYQMHYGTMTPALLDLLQHPSREIRIDSALLLSQRHPVELEAIEMPAEDTENLSPRYLDYLYGLNLVKRNYPQLIHALRDGATGPVFNTQIACLEQLVRRGIVDSTLAREVEGLRHRALNQNQSQRLTHLESLFNSQGSEQPRTNAHPRTVAGRQSVP
jgi:hypothetical protein